MKKHIINLYALFGFLFFTKINPMQQQENNIKKIWKNNKGILIHGATILTYTRLKTKLPILRNIPKKIDQFILPACTASLLFHSLIKTKNTGEENEKKQAIKIQEYNRTIQQANQEKESLVEKIRAKKIEYEEALQKNNTEIRNLQSEAKGLRENIQALQLNEAEKLKEMTEELENTKKRVIDVFQGVQHNFPNTEQEKSKCQNYDFLRDLQNQDIAILSFSERTQDKGLWENQSSMTSGSVTPMTFDPTVHFSRHIGTQSDHNTTKDAWDRSRLYMKAFMDSEKLLVENQEQMEIKENPKSEKMAYLDDLDLYHHYSFGDTYYHEGESIGLSFLIMHLLQYYLNCPISETNTIIAATGSLGSWINDIFHPSDNESISMIGGIQEKHEALKMLAENNQNKKILFFYPEGNDYQLIEGIDRSEKITYIPVSKTRDIAKKIEHYLQEDYFKKDNNSYQIQSLRKELTQENQGHYMESVFGKAKESINDSIINTKSAEQALSALNSTINSLKEKKESIARNMVSLFSSFFVSESHKKGLIQLLEGHVFKEKEETGWVKNLFDMAVAYCIDYQDIDLFTKLEYSYEKILKNTEKYKDIKEKLNQLIFNGKSEVQSAINIFADTLYQKKLIDSASATYSQKDFTVQNIKEYLNEIEKILERKNFQDNRLKVYIGLKIRNYFTERVKHNTNLLETVFECYKNNILKDDTNSEWVFWDLLWDNNLRDKAIKKIFLMKKMTSRWVCYFLESSLIPLETKVKFLKQHHQFEYYHDSSWHYHTFNIHESNSSEFQKALQDHITEKTIYKQTEDKNFFLRLKN